jgi:toxin ParE1/3/4
MLALSRRALRDLEEIRRYSKKTWGARVASQYLDKIQHALQLLDSEPELLTVRPELSEHLKFYRVEKHFLVCTTKDENVYVLAVRHGAMDLPSRVAELEPTLKREAEILHQAFSMSTGTSSV